ncbi:MAG: 3-carboxy-cis,cis-muconate cycloisomerase [Mycobacterium sp.]
MTDLFWPGDQRAGDVMSDAAFLTAMVRVETAWLTVLVDAGVAPDAARVDLGSTLRDGDLETIARGAEADGNPVTGLVALLRERTGGPPAQWLHRGLTSQDVVDTALVLCARDALDAVSTAVLAQVRTLADLVETHRDAPMVARTLTQHAVPSTVGGKFAVWLAGVLDAVEPLAALRSSLPVQAGGAAGTLAATTELAGSADAALGLVESLATALYLVPALPWHTRRAPITRIGDALVTCCDAWGHLAADVATLSRPEIGELSEGHAGKSSTMPHKQNPVLSVLIRRAALSTGPLASTLHTASACSVDERADGAWHVEWATLRTLARRTVVAAAQTADLLAHLRIDVERSATILADADGMDAEQLSMAKLTEREPLPSYLGATDRIVDAVLQRASQYLKEAT